jgi:hypothetical protein
LIPQQGAMVKFFLLPLLRPVGRFLAQCISVSTDPGAFVRENIRLGDTTNFLSGDCRCYQSTCARMPKPLIVASSKPAIFVPFGTVVLVAVMVVIG